MYKERFIRPILQKYLTLFPVTLVVGPRQAGKTTLMMQLEEKGEYSYISFDELFPLSAAKKDPIGFLEGLKSPVILDEIQRVPQLFLPLKRAVDKNRKPGSFILTGSANPLLLPNLGDSLAGRMGILELYPFSQSEIRQSPKNFIDELFHNNWTWEKISSLSKQELACLILKGGYPNVYDKNFSEIEIWFKSYLKAIIERDIRDLHRIEGISELPGLLQLIAARVATILNYSEVSRSFALSRATLQRYFHLFQTTYLIEFLPAWHKNLSKRIIKAPKVYLNDTGLAGYLLHIDPTALENTPNLFGSLTENFVIMEIKKQLTWSQNRCHLYYFRTQEGVEVDCILENGQGKVIGIEIKSSSTLTPQDFKGLKMLKMLAGQSFLKGICLYRGNDLFNLEEDLHALPIQCLWN